ncbi:copper chaperone PCu(A)C [Martelella sp. HB161492]|uniref:copper chaperone PCu(A)C n=1 Tax=Martelella sp. HB161492 TaxID=2720726 RepID=UPI0015922CB4|nr:copper chaperone PCu(A)C [Martelella sp. HB161492]
MNRRLLQLAVAGALFLASQGGVYAQTMPKMGDMHSTDGETLMLGDLVLGSPFARATLPGAPVGGGFLTIANHGGTDDRLLSAESDIAGQVQLHNMRMEGDVMRMYQLKDGIDIPAGGTVTLAPGGMHIMFMKLHGPLVEGDIVKVKLTFEKAGSIIVDFPVLSVAAGADGKAGMNMTGN